MQELFDEEVKIIFDSVFSVLREDKTKTFTHAEIKYFKMWWMTQSKEDKEVFREIVNEGRWEFVNGGLVSSDEACPTFIELVQNLRMGHYFLKQEFGIDIKIAWHADSFGHSSSFA